MPDDGKPERSFWRELWAFISSSPARYVLAIFGLWWAFVGVSGLQLPEFGKHWDFEVTGQLGDSFGILSALMTSLAAIFTYQTLRDTREQARAFESRERKSVDRDERRDSENTYFRLLEMRVSVLSDMCQIDDKAEQHRGSDATHHLAEFIKSYNRARPKEYHQTDEELYLLVYRQNRNDLGHYFRFTYHIIKYASEKFGRRAYDYVRLLRAQLSNSELILIALNCAYGEGKEKFKPWVERYALLHNIDPTDRMRFRLDDLYKPSAFERKTRAKSSPPS